MALYEHVFVARQDLTQQQIEQLVEQYKTLLAENGAKVERVEHWGLRTLAYRINKSRKAYYVLMNIDGPSAAIDAMERQMRINEDVLRYLTIRVEEFEKEPSAILARRDKDDIRTRRPREYNREYNKVSGDA